MDTVLIGDKERFLVEVGEYYGGTKDCRRVDMWAADRWLTCDDNHVHVGSFVHQVRRTIERLRSEDSERNLAPPATGLTPTEMHRQARRNWSVTCWQLMNWGPTTDNFLAYVFRVGGRLVITFEFPRKNHNPTKERGRTFMVELSMSEFIEILEQMVEVLGDNREKTRADGI